MEGVSYHLQATRASIVNEKFHVAVDPRNNIWISAQSNLSDIQGLERTKEVLLVKKFKPNQLLSPHH
jgi:hypothetical protein